MTDLLRNIKGGFRSLRSPAVLCRVLIACAALLTVPAAYGQDEIPSDDIPVPAVRDTMPLESTEEPADTTEDDGGNAGIREDSLLQLLEDVDSELDSLKQIEQDVRDMSTRSEESSVTERVEQSRKEEDAIVEQLDDLREYEMQMLNMLGFHEGNMDLQVQQVQNSIDELEKRKREIIEELIKEKIKINKELPFLEREVETSAQMQMRKYEEFLRKYPDSEFADNIMFRLADFHYREVENSYDLEMEKYNDQMDEFMRMDSLYQLGEIATAPVEPAFPEKDFSRSIRYCTQIVSEFPKSDVRDDALYNLGFFYEQEKSSEKALAMYKELIDSYPESRYVTESILRVGEFYFDHPEVDSGRGLEEAITVYKKLLPYWYDKNFSTALYKLGWTYYRLSDFKNAISYFVYLLDDERRIKDSNVEDLKTTYNFEKEAIRYISMSFRENVPEEQLFSDRPWNGVPEKSRKFVETFRSKPYAPLILEELGNIYREIDQNLGAIETYEQLLMAFSDYRGAQKIQMAIIEMYDRLAGDPDIEKKFGKGWAEGKANEARVALFSRYGKEWANANLTDKEEKDKAYKQAKDAIYYVAVAHYEKGRTQKNADEFEMAIRYFRDFLGAFPYDPQAYEIRWIIAQTLDTELKRPEDAFKEYVRVSQYKKFNKHKEEAAQNAFVIADELLKNAKAAHPADSTLKEVTPEEKRYIFSIENFIALLPDHANVPVLLANKASVYYGKELFEEAKVVYDELIKKYPKRPESIEALKLIASAYAKRNHYERAIDWFKKWREATDNPAEKQDANNYIAQNLRSIAELYKKKGEHQNAAKAFERVVAEQPDYKFAAQTLFDAAQEYEKVPDYRQAAIIYQQIVMNYPGWDYAPGALYNAALAFDKNGDKRQAAQIYEQLAKIYPDSKEYLNNAIYNAAVKYEELEDWRNAARVFEWFVDVNPDDKEARDFLFTAGKYYGKIGDERKAKNIFDKFSAKYPDDMRVIEIQYDLAMGLFKKEKFEEAKAKFYEVLAAFEKSGNPADYVHRAAESQYRITEMDYKEYDAIEFRLPQRDLDAALERKKNMLVQINEKYVQVASYGIINWAPEATYKIGRNFEEFANTFERQEIPDDLPTAEEVSRRKKLKLQLALFLEKAIEPYKTTINLKEQLKGEAQDTLIAPWVILAKKKVLETVYRIAIAKKEAQMTELEGLSESDSTAESVIKNMKVQQKIGRRLMNALPDFERCFAEAESLGIRVAEVKTGAGSGVSMIQLMRSMVSPDAVLSEEMPTIDDTMNLDDAEEMDADSLVADSLAADSAMMASAPDTLTMVLPPDSGAAVPDTAGKDTVLQQPEPEEEETAAADTADKYKIDIDISDDPIMLATVYNAKVELSHLLYTSGNLNIKGALEFLALPIPDIPQLKPPLNRITYQKTVAQQGTKLVVPGLESFIQGIQVASVYGIESKWVDQMKRELIKGSNIGSDKFSDLSLQSVRNFKDYSELYRKLYETGDVSEDGMDAYEVEGLLGQFADFGRLFGKVAFGTFQGTFDMAMTNGIEKRFTKSNEVKWAEFVYAVGQAFENLSGYSGGIAEMYEKYVGGDTTVNDSVAEGLDQMVAEDLTYVFMDQRDLFHDYCIELYEEGYMALEEYKIKNEWTIKIRDRLAALLPDVYGRVEDMVLDFRHLGTDTDWRATSRRDSSWLVLDFPDSTWARATIAPWPDSVSIPAFDTLAARAVWDSGGADTVFLRKKFKVVGNLLNAVVTITANDNYRLYVNGEYITADDTVPGDWRETEVVDVTEFLAEGDNFIGIWACNSDSSGFGVKADLFIKSDIKGKEEQISYPEGTQDALPADSGSVAVPDAGAGADSSGNAPEREGTDVPADTGTGIKVPAGKTDAAADTGQAAPDSLTGDTGRSQDPDAVAEDNQALCKERTDLANTQIQIEQLKIKQLKQDIAGADSSITSVRRELDALQAGDGSGRETENAPVPDDGGTVLPETPEESGENVPDGDADPAEPTEPVSE